jgi:hypothetical protein
VGVRAWTFRLNDKTHDRIAHGYSRNEFWGSASYFWFDVDPCY